MNYTVQPYDTPDLIALKLAGTRAQAGALVNANPAKPRQVVGGRVTFASLEEGESLRLPGGWNPPRGIAGLPSQGLADPVSDGSAVALFAYLQANPNQSGCTPNASVSTFQTSYNGANPSSQLTVDGLYGSGTDAALRATLPSNTFPAIQLCPSGGGAATGGGGSTSPIVVAPATDNTLLYGVAGLAAVAAVVGIVVAVKHHHAMQTVAGPVSSRRRPAARRRR